MAIVNADLVTRYPSLFGGESTAKMDALIVEAYQDLPSGTGLDADLLDRGALLYCAHKQRLERADDLIQGAALKNMKERDNVSVDILDHSKSYWQKTIYGEEYLKIKRRLFGGSMFVV